MADNLRHAQYDEAGVGIDDPQAKFRALGQAPDNTVRYPNGVMARVANVTFQSAVPVLIAPNGTVATNGTITLGTALSIIYNGGLWVYLPAGAVVGGLAGYYWTVMSSTTVGQVTTEYRAADATFVPTLGTSTTVAVGSNAGYTQTTGAAILLATVKLLANSIGAYGSVRSTFQVENNNSAGTKSYVMSFRGTGGGPVSVIGAATTSTTTMTQHRVANRGRVDRQVGTVSFTSPFGASSNPIFNYTVDTAQDSFEDVSGNLAVATDWIILQMITVETLPYGGAYGG